MAITTHKIKRTKIVLTSPGFVYMMGELQIKGTYGFAPYWFDIKV